MLIASIVHSIKSNVLSNKKLSCKVKAFLEIFSVNIKLENEIVIV